MSLALLKHVTFVCANEFNLSLGSSFDIGSRDASVASFPSFVGSKINHLKTGLNHTDITMQLISIIVITIKATDC
jgi:hypothetical protein